MGEVKRMTEAEFRKFVRKLYLEERAKLVKEGEAGDVISDANDDPEDVKPKEGVQAGGDNIEKPLDWVKALKLPQAEGKKLVSTIQRLVKEELAKQKKSVPPKKK